MSDENSPTEQPERGGGARCILPLSNKRQASRASYMYRLQLVLCYSSHQPRVDTRHRAIDLESGPRTSDAQCPISNADRGGGE